LAAATRPAPDWAAAYAEMDATRAAAAAAAAAARPEPLPAPSDLPSDPEGVRSNEKGKKKKTDWEAAYRDIEATRALARAGGETKSSSASRDSPDSDSALALDLMDKLAAIGSEGAETLLAQSPKPRNREED
jgi:hypothetical protein